MATVRGRCSNFDYCMVAERRIVLDVDVGAGAAFICPECGRALGAPPVAARSGAQRFAATLGVAILVVGGGLYGAALLQPGRHDRSVLPPWLDPAAQTHAAEQPPTPSFADPPPLPVAAATPAPPREMPPPPHVPPVPPRPNQPTPSEPREMALGSAALMPLMVSVTNRLASTTAPPPAPPPKFTFVVPAHLDLPANRPAPTQDGVYDQYHDLIDGNRRLAICFHFAPHAIGLDEAGMRDIDRLVKYLTAAGAQSGHVILVGFSDTDGARPHSLDLARRRAAVVAAVLAQRGVNIAQSAAFGADLPVAHNTTPAGRAMNRRVEVFMRP
jgi:outer membrane protein OmpA-like peptidoglycan-associated protein